MSGGWLTAQLPRAMAEDPVLYGIANIIEDVADTLRCDVDSIEQHLDIATASAPMLRYLASWVGADLDPGISVERQREVLRTIAASLGRRGTRRGLEELLTGLTGARARVDDRGGVYTGNEQRPPADLRVIVELNDLGEFNERQLHALIMAELPAGAQLELHVPAVPDAEGPTGKGSERR